MPEDPFKNMIDLFEVRIEGETGFDLLRREGGPDVIIRQQELLEAEVL
jgi:hypothetical protein